MATVFDLANLSSMTYDITKTRFREWERKERYGNSLGKGFYAELYLNGLKKQAAFVIRGTDGDDWNDLYSDLQIGLGQIPSQFKAAEKAFKSAQNLISESFVGKYEIYLSGHSLGGGLASLVSAKQGGLPTVTFNAPGMMRSFYSTYLFRLIGVYQLLKVDTSKMLHLRASGDPVSISTGQHMGKVREVYVDKWGDDKILGASRYLAQHSIKNMLEALKYRPDLHDQLKRS